MYTVTTSLRPAPEPHTPERERQRLPITGERRRANPPTSLLVQYVRDSKRRPVGVLVANARGVGWSYASRYDRFDKRLGRIIAFGRLIRGTSGSTRIPYLVEQQLEPFRQRAQEFFYDDHRVENDNDGTVAATGTTG